MINTTNGGRKHRGGCMSQSISGLLLLSSHLLDVFMAPCRIKHNAPMRELADASVLVVRANKVRATDYVQLVRMARPELYLTLQVRPICLLQFENTPGVDCRCTALGMQSLHETPTRIFKKLPQSTRPEEDRR